MCLVFLLAGLVVGALGHAVWAVGWMVANPLKALVILLAAKFL